ncbi:MAG TPA: sugar phosphate nucleotidyltransferase [Oligoflexia bacterium]|nr:sugar phosphate nucleotidyltransferase [Oligoflexia bacterium]HMP27545.1 sugar phosphate nucleotidyltransferase [Oligoflexia bacterium]
MKAMLFAAGVGSRLKELSASKPKALVEIAGQPMIAVVIERLKNFGVSHLVINLHHFPEQIKDCFRKRDNFGLKIDFSEESVLLDTGGGLKFARRFFQKDETFLIHNCDIYSEVDYADLLKLHQASEALATLAVKKRKSERGVLVDQNGYFVGWKGSDGPILALGKEAAESIPFCGIHFANYNIFDYMPFDKDKFSILEAYKNAVSAGERVLTYDIGDKYWIDVGTPEKVEELSNYLALR